MSDEKIPRPPELKDVEPGSDADATPTPQSPEQRNGSHALLKDEGTGRKPSENDQHSHAGLDREKKEK